LYDYLKTATVGIAKSTNTNAMKKAVKLSAEDAMKNEKTSLNGHGWLWISIILLGLGQAISFIYLIHSQKDLIDNFNPRLKCSCPQIDEISFSSPTNFSVGKEDLAAHGIFVTTDSEPSAALTRRKRSSVKPHKNSNKVSYDVTMPLLCSYSNVTNTLFIPNFKKISFLTKICSQ
jgi:hypothetical protein